MAKLPRSPVLQRIQQAWVGAPENAGDRLHQLGMESDQLQRIIEGVRVPSSTDLALLSIAFQVSVEWLITGTGPQYIGPIYGPDDDVPTRDKEGKPLVLVGWYCWRCHNINSSACRSDSVPMYVPQQWETEMTREILRREEEVE